MVKKPKKDRHVGVPYTTRLPEEISEKLKALAEKERRFYGNMIEVLIEEALQARERTSGLAFK